jgi:hypothetical protein
MHRYLYGFYCDESQAKQAWLSDAVLYGQAKIIFPKKYVNILIITVTLDLALIP